MDTAVATSRTTQQREGQRSPAGPIALTWTRMRATLAWSSVWISAGIVLCFAIVGDDRPITERLVFVVGAGVLVGLVTWSVGAWLTKGAVLPDVANPRSYHDLEWRIDALDAALERVPEADRDPRFDWLTEAKTELRDSLGSRGADLGWSSGLNYILSWRQLHRLEEELIYYTPADREAMTDVLAHDIERVDGSQLDRQGTALRADIDQARARLEDGKDLATMAPLLIRIRHAVNEYRDRRFEALVSGRLDLDHKTTVLGLGACALLSLAILFDAPVDAVVSVAVYYLIGVGAALFAQVRGNGLSDALVDVYGYGAAQLRQTMLVSGLAAVVGVIVVWTAAQGTSEATMHDLTAAIVLTPANLLTAAAFGLTPGLLLDRVHGWAKTNIGELEVTATGEGSAKTRPNA